MKCELAQTDADYFPWSSNRSTNACRDRDIYCRHFTTVPFLNVQSTTERKKKTDKFYCTLTTWI